MIVLMDQTLSLPVEQTLDTLVVGVSWTVVGKLGIFHRHRYIVHTELCEFFNNFAGVIVRLKFQNWNSRYSVHFIISFPVNVFLDKFCG